MTPGAPGHVTLSCDGSDNFSSIHFYKFMRNIFKIDQSSNTVKIIKSLEKYGHLIWHFSAHFFVTLVYCKFILKLTEFNPKT